MILYLTAKTESKDVVIDYIEVRLNNGKQVSLNWDESDIVRDDDGFTARYKGIYFDEEYANGKIELLHDLNIVEVGLYSEENEDYPVTITEIEFYDANESYNRSLFYVVE